VKDGLPFWTTLIFVISVHSLPGIHFFGGKRPSILAKVLFLNGLSIPFFYYIPRDPCLFIKNRLTRDSLSHSHTHSLSPTHSLSLYLSLCMCALRAKNKKKKKKKKKKKNKKKRYYPQAFSIKILVSFFSFQLFTSTPIRFSGLGKPSR
jgi:hypothetical protein